MIFRENMKNRKLRGMTGFLITVMIFLNIGTTGNAQTNRTGSFGIERIRQLSILLKLSLEEYERIRKEIPRNIPKIIVILENIVNILKEIKTIRENLKDSEERIEKIKRLIELYEGKLSYYRGTSTQ